MYPQPELTLLAAQKVLLRQGIARRRAQCAFDAASVTKPLEWLDRALALWGRIPPLTKLVVVPLGLLVIKRTIFSRPKFGLLGSLLRWGSVGFGVISRFKKLNKIRAESVR